MQRSSNSPDNRDFFDASHKQPTSFFKNTNVQISELSTDLNIYIYLICLFQNSQSNWF